MYMHSACSFEIFIIYNTATRMEDTAGCILSMSSVYCEIYEQAL